MKINIRNIFNEIIKIKKEYDNVSICINSENINNVHTPHKFDENTKVKIVENIKKMHPSTTLKHITQKESFFRDLIKLEIISEFGDTVSYCKKKNLLGTVENVMFLITQINTIQSDSFPKLFKYDHIETKKLMIIEMAAIDIIIVENFQNNILVNIKNSKKEVLLNELTSILNILNNFI
jgi:hypothetical protein